MLGFVKRYSGEFVPSGIILYKVWANAYYRLVFNNTFSFNKVHQREIYILQLLKFMIIKITVSAMIGCNIKAVVICDSSEQRSNHMYVCFSK